MFLFMIETRIEKPEQRFEFTINNKNRTDFRAKDEKIEGQICAGKGRPGSPAGDAVGHAQQILQIQRGEISNNAVRHEHQVRETSFSLSE